MAALKTAISRKINIKQKNHVLNLKSFLELHKLKATNMSFNEGASALLWDNTDSEPENKHKIMVFVPNWSRSFMIEKVEIINADGTYKKCPTPFCDAWRG